MIIKLNSFWSCVIRAIEIIFLFLQKIVYEEHTLRTKISFQ